MSAVGIPFLQGGEDVKDSFHRDPQGHFRGTRLVIEHIERHWCPTITSDELAGGEPFRFAGVDETSHPAGA